eukprot:gene30386-35393_t
MYDPGNHKGIFTSEEKEVLHELVQKHSGQKHKWSRIGKLIGRSQHFCRATWFEIRLGDKQKHGKWTSKDEHRLRLLVTEQMAARKEKEGAGMKLRLEQMSEVQDAVASPPVFRLRVALGSGVGSSGPQQNCRADYLEKSFDVCVDELAEKYSSHRCRQVLENLE